MQPNGEISVVHSSENALYRLNQSKCQYSYDDRIRLVDLICDLNIFRFQLWKRILLANGHEWVIRWSRFNERKFISHKLLRAVTSGTTLLNPVPVLQIIPYIQALYGTYDFCSCSLGRKSILNRDILWFWRRRMESNWCWRPCTTSKQLNSLDSRSFINQGRTE